MGKIAFGQGFGVLVQFCVGFYSLGSCISYVVLIGDFLVRNIITNEKRQTLPNSRSEQLAYPFLKDSGQVLASTMVLQPP